MSNTYHHSWQWSEEDFVSALETANETVDRQKNLLTKVLKAYHEDIDPACPFQEWVEHIDHLLSLEGDLWEGVK